jgi:DNA-binding NtrC family response regulator
MTPETAGVGDARVRVLYVGTDSDDTETLSTALERENNRFTVETARTVDEAMARLAAEPVDCLVSDYRLSNGNGIELLETVRDEYPALPFIIYTAQGSEAVASEAISAGVTDYLRKEPGAKQHAGLANRISDAVDHSRSQQAVSERNRALQSYERMVNSMQEAACIYDAEDRFEIVNETIAEWYDTTRNELEGQTSRLVPRI